MQDISIRLARATFANMINKVAFGEKAYKITRYGKPIAVMISIDKWNEIEKLIQVVKIVE